MLPEGKYKYSALDENGKQAIRLRKSRTQTAIVIPRMQFTFRSLTYGNRILNQTCDSFLVLEEDRCNLLLTNFNLKVTQTKEFAFPRESKVAVTIQFLCGVPKNWRDLKGKIVDFEVTQ